MLVLRARGCGQWAVTAVSVRTGVQCRAAPFVELPLASRSGHVGTAWRKVAVESHGVAATSEPQPLAVGSRWTLVVSKQSCSVATGVVSAEGQCLRGSVLC